MFSPSSCSTCRMVRRVVFAFGAGVMLMFYLTGKFPDPSRDAQAIQGILTVVIIFTGLSIFFRVKQMRAKWRR